MLTVSAFAKAFGVDSSTVRRWAFEFAEYLSPEANPPEGEVRRFTVEDGEVLALVAELRERDYASFETIHAGLAAGERGQWPPVGQSEDEGEEAQPGEGQPQGQLVLQLAAKASRLEGQVESLQNERDYLRGEVKALTEQLIEAREQAARASARPPGPEASPQSERPAVDEDEETKQRLAELEAQLEAERARSWWDKLRGR